MPSIFLFENYKWSDFAFDHSPSLILELDLVIFLPELRVRLGDNKLVLDIGKGSTLCSGNVQEGHVNHSFVIIIHKLT